MSHFPGLNPISTVRESKVIANQETIANQTQIVTSNNAKFKRTVYHTPAIIQTIVDTPQIVAPPPQPLIIRSEPISRIPVRNPILNSNYIVAQPPSAVIRRPELEDRVLGVKVHQDLSGFRQTIVQAHQQVKSKGFCHRILGCCWGNKCPFWMFILIPILLILLLLLISYFVNKHRVFYGYDTSTINGINTSNLSNLGENLNINTNINPNINPLSQRQETVSPIVSTDTNANVPNINSNTDLANLNSNNNFVDRNTNTIIQRNQSVSTHVDPLNSNIGDPNVPLTGGDIYSRVLARQRLQTSDSLNPGQTISQTKTETTTTQNNDLVNQTPGIIQNKTTVSQTKTDGIRLAPTIQQIRTRLMIDNERAGIKTHQTSKSHKAQYHLRHFVH